MFELVRDIYRYRELIWILTQKELKLRYKRSVLGILWALLRPLFLLVVLTLVFAGMIGFRIKVENYSIFLASALFPWTFFHQAMGYSVQCLNSNGSLIRKVYVPKLVFPVAVVLANFINYLLTFIPLILMLLILDFPFHPSWIYLPIPLLSLVFFTLGCAFLFSTINVFFHDMQHLLGVLLSGYFYFCPIILDLRIVESRFHGLFQWNPLLYILNGFRSAIYYGEPPSAHAIAVGLGGGVLMMLVGFGLFRRYQDSFPLYV